MRIRKRKVPLPLSLLSPVPLSDPHLFSQSPVHQLHPQLSDHFTPTSASDLRPLIVVGTSNNTTPPEAKEEEEEQQQQSCLKFQAEGEGEGERGGERILHNNNNDDDDASKEEQLTGNYNYGPGYAGVLLSNEGRWSEGERVIPLKKRRTSGSFFENKDMDNDHDEEKAAVVISNSIISSSKEQNNKKGSGGGSNKQKRGTTIMEGSRCSRVNGRGWRCCQPTLVGYSLCEHHLGKGRLRSMTCVRGRPAKKQAAVVKDNRQEKPQQQQQSNKRVSYKLGVVKARSLSSLLGQTTSTTATNNTNNNVDRNDIKLGNISIGTHESDAHVVVN